jgi:hypothetical protein
MSAKNKLKKVPKQFQRVLWSYDINKMDLEKDKREIIIQVLNYGTWEDLKLLYKSYSEEEIKQVVKNPRRGVWFKKVLNFWTTIFNIRLKKEIWDKAIFR